jgi:hypothetical protein
MDEIKKNVGDDVLVMIFANKSDILEGGEDEI